MKYNFAFFRENLLQFNLKLTDKMEEQFAVYYDLLIEWNEVMNLTSVTEFDKVVEKHFLDSVSLAHYFDLCGNLKCIDVGTGAGFPGIPLKILFPNLDMLLLDSVKKKTDFLDNVIFHLNLENISAVHGRAEDFAGKEDYREKFDLCVSRAVSNLSTLSEYCMPFVKVNGMFISYKAKDIEAEAKEAENAVSILGGRLKEIQKFRLSSSQYERSFVMVEKIKRTPKKYPRKAGTPTKQPL